MRDILCQRGLFLPMPVVRRFAKSVYRLVILNARIPLKYQRRIANALSMIAKLPNGVLVVKTALGDRPAERIMAPTAHPNRVLLYLRGGGYTLGLPATHRAIAVHLAARGRVVCHVIDYRLAPEHPYPTAVEQFAAWLRGAFGSVHQATSTPGLPARRRTRRMTAAAFRPC